LDATADMDNKEKAKIIVLAGNRIPLFQQVVAIPTELFRLRIMAIKKKIIYQIHVCSYWNSKGRDDGV
jgi:hypothetical protein